VAGPFVLSCDLQLISLHNRKSGGTVTSWLVRSTPEKVSVNYQCDESTRNLITNVVLVSLISFNSIFYRGRFSCDLTENIHCFD